MLWCLTALAATGCWDRREIETLAVATAIAVDRLEAEGSVLVTAQFAIPSRLGGATGGGPTVSGMGGGGGPGSGMTAPFARTTGGPLGPTTWVVGAPAPTVTEALDRLARISPRIPFWAHVRLLVIGEEMARSGIRTVLDTVLRGREARRTSWLVVARGLPAYRVLELPSPLAASPDEGLARLMEILQATTAVTIPQRLQDFLAAYALPGMDPVTAAITYELPVPHSPLLTPSREELPALPRSAGAAVFRDDRLAGWLSPEEARALLLVMGRSQQFRVSAPCPRGTGLAVVRVMRFRSRRQLNIPGPNPERTAPALPAFAVRVEGEGLLNEQTCDPPLDPGSLRELERQLARQFEASMLATLRRLHRELRADPVGFGLQLRRTQPSRWAALRLRWREALAEVPVSVGVHLAIRRTGFATGEAEPEG